MMCKLFVLFLCVNFGYSANILGITTLPSHSHHLWNEVLIIGLAERGHNVTTLALDRIKTPHKNYHSLYVEGAYEPLETVRLEDAPENSDKQFSSPNDFWDFLVFSCNNILESSAFKTLMNYPPDYKFDIIFYDVSGGGECLYPLVKRFGNPPIIGVSPFGNQPFVTWFMGGHIYSYIPFYGVPYKSKLNLFEKLKNIIAINYFIYVRQTSYIKNSEEIAKKYFGNDIEDFHAIERNISLILVNSNHVIEFPQMTPPNILMVGGLQIKPTKPLPKDLEEIYAKSKNGVIYFSLGSNLKSEYVKEEILQSFVDCFKTLPETILWKIDHKTLKLPSNVVTKTWLPQSDILANPKTKLFISHGGSLSTQESIYHGVPVLGLPFFLDQHSNIHRIESRNWGKSMDYLKLSSNYICEKIKEAKDEGILKNVKLASKRIQDTQNKPLETAIFAFEYILRHGNGEHLSIAARDMNIIESLNIDVAILVLLILLSPILFLILLYRVCCRSKQPKIKAKKN